MYQNVNQNSDTECESSDINTQNNSTMDDRDSIYLDTISLASEYPNRKSMSLSRQTIYHSAEDFQIDQQQQRQSTQTSPTAEFLTQMRKSSRPPIVDGYGNDEVSTRLLIYNNKTVTYSQWKSRTWRHFQDGIRSVDFVLAYPADDPHPRNDDKRKMFEINLQNEGLELEREQTQRIHFVKIHAPKDVLCRYSEYLKIKMPIKKVREQDEINKEEFQLLEQVKSFIGTPFNFVDLDKKLFPGKDYRLKHEFSRNLIDLFDTDDPQFFTPATSILIVQFILERQRFSDEDDSSNNVGIDRLLSDGVYAAAYPLHDGDCELEGSQRHLLYTEWASVKKWIRHQPLDNIKEYFGVKIALYFAWLGFYTHMLISASVVGVITFFYGMATSGSNTISEDICKSNNSILMCPQCDKECDYWDLSTTCQYSKVMYWFDNDMTVFFACFMSFWAILYLELWKRYSAKLIHEWGMSDYCLQAEHPRPQYLERLKSTEKRKFNVIHRVLEPHVPFWKVKFPVYVMSFSAVLLFIVLAILTVFGITIYRMSLIYSKNLLGEVSQTYMTLVLPATAGVLNLVIIIALNQVYYYAAVYLTNIEYRRTQTEYDESLTLKIYLFQFVNYYSSIFYIAFLKGQFVGYPAKYNRIFDLRQEECVTAGCLMELSIQLIIIMVGKQAVNAVIETWLPFFIKKWNSIYNRIGKPDPTDGESLISCNQWTNDYKHLAWSSSGLFDDYLEMVIQYGFVTIFVVAFPLAPLFALLNNIFEMRLDAKKFLLYYRRPVPTRAKDIGVWFNIMSVLGRIAVVSSAFIIAFSSNFIPRLVYRYAVNPNHTDEGFLNHTLAYFNITEFQSGSAPNQTKFENITMCRYKAYRNPPWDENKYKKTALHWHVLAARLAFLVAFENAVGFVQMIVAWAIPDVPRKLSEKQKREEYLTREIIIDYENRRPRRHMSLSSKQESYNGSVKESDNSRNGKHGLDEFGNSSLKRRARNHEDDIESTDI